MPRRSPRKPDRPVFWIINPDLLTAKIVESEGVELASANLAAVERIEAWLERSIDAFQTIGVETVLSSPKYRRLVDLAHGRGFEVRMIYVLLRSVGLQMERIRHRVADGGHDVPADKVAARRTRSFEQLAWFARHADRLFVYDNSDGSPTLLGLKEAGRELAFLQRPPGDLSGALLQAGYPVNVDRKLRI